MDKYYISDKFKNRIHTIRVTFQFQEYKGHISYDVYGDHKGLNAMNFDFISMITPNARQFIEIDFVENDCNFRWNKDYEVWRLDLKDKNGKICKCHNIESAELYTYVVAIEIINCCIEED